MFSNISKEVLAVSVGVAGLALGTTGTYLYMKKKMDGRIKDLELDTAQFNAQVQAGLGEAAKDSVSGTDAALRAELKKAQERADKFAEAELKTRREFDAVKAQAEDLRQEINALNEVIKKTEDRNLEGTAWGMYKSLFRLAKTKEDGTLFDEVPGSWKGAEYITDLEALKDTETFGQFKHPGLYAVMLPGNRRGVLIVKPNNVFGLMYERYSVSERSTTVILYSTLVKDSTAGHITDTFFENTANLLRGVKL